MQDLGRMLIVLGLAVVVLGALLLLGPRIPWLGRLPGDIVVRREHGVFYFPIVTCLVVSVVLSLILSIIFRR